ncbi:hypothetical protein [Haladaptatus caseinilyticus]|uniref:hypothetical protein n=1 Tax=Haladaptatus caseinilyticus TaxID=2993314 RepID=UPI00224B7C9E|nr:hypothetical protein [Haladaptatus caseinilyticus]
MSNATLQIVVDHPVTLLPLLFTAWIVYKLVQRYRTKVLTGFAAATTIMLAPVLLFTFLAEFTENQLFRALSNHVLDIESAIIDALFRFLDVAIATELRVVVLIVDGTWNMLQGSVTSVIPMLEPVILLLMMFAIEFVAGAGLIYALYVSSYNSNLDFMLKGVGVVLLISGAFVTFIQLDIWQTSESLLVSAFIAAMLGFTFGVASVISFLRPNFGEKSVNSTRHESVVRPSDEDEDSLRTRVMGAVSRFNSSWLKRKE